MKIFGILLFSFFALQARALFEPSLECTVIRVLASRPALGFSKFPVLHMSFYNDASKSVLKMGGKTFLDLKPVSTFKTLQSETILIAIPAGNLEFVLSGKPISRQGQLRLNGLALADLTCH